MGNKQGRENKFLDKEYAERIQAENALAYGNYAGATWHDSRADRWGYKADKVHYGMYNKGRAANGQAYALHPVPPASGIAAFQPGVPPASQVLTPAAPLAVPGSPVFGGAAPIVGTGFASAYPTTALGATAYPAAGPAILPAAYSASAAAAYPGTFGAAGAYPVASSAFATGAAAPIVAGGAYNMW